MSARDLGRGASIDRHESIYYGVCATEDHAPPLALFTTEEDAWAWVKQQQEAEELCKDVDVVMVAARCEVWNSVDGSGCQKEQLMELLGQDVPS
jgi:hypothetical protein